jgi:hypothetical protein
MTKKVMTQEEFIDFMNDFIDSIDEKERPYLAENICFNAAVWGADTDHGSFGILEMAKHELHKEFDSQLNEMIGDHYDKEIETALKEEVKKQGS